MVDEKIPELTLAPDLDAAPVAPQAPAVEQQAPSAGPEMEKLTEKEQQAVLAFAEKIDLSNSNQILQYGAAAQKNIADFSESALNSVRTKDMGEIGGMLTDLVGELKSFDAGEEEKKGLFGFFRKAGNSIDQMKTKYAKVEANVDRISESLENHQITLLKDVALQVEDSPTSESFRVMGRGEMHLSILIETMRREGYELQVSPPKVLLHEVDGKTMEPMEHVVIDVPTEYQGSVMQKLGSRKGELVQMAPLGSTRMRVEFRIPSRGLFGYRSEFLTDTHGEGILNTIFDGYDEWRGDLPARSTGSLISYETGVAVAYGLFNAQQRGTLIVDPGDKVYEGMVVGYSPAGEDITVNVCKTKHLSNTRASGSDDALRLVPVSKFSLEESLEFLKPDELLEVTPSSIRIRKRILNHDLRMKATKGGKNIG